MSKIQNDKAQKFDKTGDYYTDLAIRESSNDPKAENKKFRYIGLYQMGEAALVDTGYYKKDPKPGQKPGTQYNNDWEGNWIGKHGVNSKDEFLANPTAQNIAIREYHKIIWEKYLHTYHKYQGQEIGGIKLTKSGMTSGAHLTGAGGMINFINSNGNRNNLDGNGISCANYLEYFQGFDVDYSTDKHIKELELLKSVSHLNDPQHITKSSDFYSDDFSKENQR